MGLTVLHSNSVVLLVSTASVKQTAVILYFENTQEVHEDGKGILIIWKIVFTYCGVFTVQTGHSKCHWNDSLHL